MPEKKYLDVEGTQHLVEKIETDLNYSEATTTASGLMSTADKIKLDGIYPGALQHHTLIADASSGTTQWIKFAEGTYGTTNSSRIHLIFKTSEGHIYQSDYADSKHMDSVLHIHLNSNLSANDLQFSLEWEYANAGIKLNNFKICVSKTNKTFACYWEVIKSYQSLNLQMVFADVFGATYNIVNEDMGGTEPSSELNAYSTVYRVHPDMLDGYITKPNLLDNPDFRVNQRNKNEYQLGTSFAYTVDRWKAINGTLTINDSGGISYTSSTDTTIYKRFLQETSTIMHTGETYTISTLARVTYKTGSIFFRPSCGLGPVAGHTNLRPTDDYTVYTYTFTASSSHDGQRLEVEILADRPTSCHVDVMYIKLEKGSTATDFVSPDPVTELQKCKYYYQRLSGNKTPVGIGYVLDDEHVRIAVSHPQMRITPTCGLNGSMSIHADGISGSIGAINSMGFSQITNVQSNQNGSFMDIDVITGDTMSKYLNKTCVVYFTSSDSYIELSADL